MSVGPQLPVLYLPRLNRLLRWDDERGGYFVDEGIPDEDLLVELNRADLLGKLDEEGTELVDGERIFAVAELRYQAHAIPDDADDKPAGAAHLRNLVQASPHTGATRAGTTGPFYPFANQRDGQPVYNPPTPTGAHDRNGGQPYMG